MNRDRSAGHISSPENVLPERPDETQSGLSEDPDAGGHPLGFPVVGIGASAGGLEALQDFFDGMDPSPDAAFVIVQHLSPDYESFMDELLRRHTGLPVEVAGDDTRVESNHIYLIPPGMNMTIRNGVLRLKKIVGRTLNLPIDIFFRSLAEDQRGAAVAIVLSGTGSDGALGIRAIKEHGGVNMVQDDRDAKFDGMPRSSVATGMVDLVRPARELARELVNYIRHPLIADGSPAGNPLLRNRQLYDRILAVLREAYQVDFSAYKQATILRRLEKRITINHFTEVKDYVDFLAASPREAALLYNDILIGVTRFFRDGEVFDAFRTNVLPALFRNHPEKNEIRLWVPGCSTGEEAYTIAMLLREYMAVNNIVAEIKIFATDIDTASLDYASIGFYPGSVSGDIPKPCLQNYFTPHGNGFQINADIRRMIIFARHDVVADPPFFNQDLISCRNLLIYLDQDAQQKVLYSFYSGLRPNGILLLGTSEATGKMGDGFTTLDSRNKLFMKREGFRPDCIGVTPGSLHVNRPTPSTPPFAAPPRPDSRVLGNLFEEIANRCLPPSVIINAKCDILYLIRNAGGLLQLASGKMTTNLLLMLPREISLIVSSMIRRAEQKDDIISADTLWDKRELNITCRRIVPGGDIAVYFCITFEENIRQDRPRQNPGVETPDLSGRYQERIDALEQEVHQKKESLQSAIEELETSNEELQASNEELVSSNEELQSANEELQSVNEELYTVNSEHVRKLEEINELNADYDNLLSNTQIGTLFLDTCLVIRKISKLACAITDILPTDVGRPLHHLSLGSLYPEFIRDVDRVNTTRQRVERELKFDGRYYFMRIVPYLIKKDTVKGIIISFVDLTESKLSAAAHRKIGRRK